jgi:hypothetical protein
MSNPTPYEWLETLHVWAIRALVAEIKLSDLQAALDEFVPLITPVSSTTSSTPWG